MIFGAILAGGTGSRMKTADMPKQFLPLKKKPIIIHTLEKFLACNQIDAVYVGVQPDWLDYMKNLADKYLSHAKDKVVVVTGGTDRNGTIMRIIDAIEAANGVSDEHMILTHDAVRPFVSLRMIEENISAVKEYGAVNTISPAIDTIVISNDGKYITDIPERTKMFLGQCPQSFKITLLKELYSSLSEDEKRVLTDACKICVIRNHPVYLVNGSVINMKITTPGDYKIAQALAEEHLCD